MIAKISQGPTFGPLCVYALDENKNALDGRKDAQVLAANRVRGWSAAEMAEDFDDQRALRPRLGRAVLHIALAWEPQESARLTDPFMEKLARAYMQELGIDPEQTQWALVRHHDQKHPHCHLLINRVTNAGGVLPDSGNFAASARACRTVEEEYGLVSAGAIGEQRHRVRVEQHALGEREAVKLLVKDALVECLPAATTMEGLRAALAEEGIRMDYPEPGSPRQGVIFTHASHPQLPVKGSEVDREYGIHKLRDTLANYAAWTLDWAAERAAEQQRLSAAGRQAPVAVQQQALIVVGNPDGQGAARLQKAAAALQQAGAQVDFVWPKVPGEVALEVRFSGQGPGAATIYRVLAQAERSDNFSVQQSPQDRETRDKASASGQGLATDERETSSDQDRER